MILYVFKIGLTMELLKNYLEKPRKKGTKKFKYGKLAIKNIR